MKEKIHELMRQCSIPVQKHRVDSVGNGYMVPNFAVEKLAELIVQECVDIANDTRYDGRVVANRIKFVFGLES